MLNATSAKEITWLIDQTTGELTVEGLTSAELRKIAADILPEGSLVNCAQPIGVPPLSNQASIIALGADESLQIFRIYHGSVVEGPGRRSVAQLSGCPIRCVGCSVPQTHDPRAGVRMSVEEVVRLVLDPVGAPRDGVTILGGEPFMQPEGLVRLIRRLKLENQHVTLYTGYTVESLHARGEPVIEEALESADIVIDGPFIARESAGAGEWRGSRNQRILIKR